MLNINPIKLLSGTHSDTGATGSGCFMNVVAYLNGEAQITDQSPCVCVTIRPLAIWLNDYMQDAERAALLPYVQRAMGTATNDADVLSARRKLVVQFAHDIAGLARDFAAQAGESAAAAATGSWASSAAHAADSAHASDSADSADSVADSAADSAHSARAASHAADHAARAARLAARAAAHAADSAAHASAGLRAARRAVVANRKKMIDLGLAFLEAACPPADPPSALIIARANQLIELAKA